MNRDLETRLRAMDVAPPRDLPSERAAQDLEKILATDPGVEPGGGADRPDVGESAGSPRRRRILVPAAASVALLGGAAIAVPALTPPAYAGWTAQGELLPAPQTVQAGETCREFWADTDLPVDEGFAPVELMEPALAEQRGSWTFTILRGPDGQLADCLLRDGRGGGGSAGVDSGAPALQPEEVRWQSFAAIQSGVRRIGGLPVPPWQQDESRSYGYGPVGTDVLAVTLHTRSQGDVEATVGNGLWAAWWPTEADDLEVGGMDATVHLADGTSYTVNVDDVWGEGPLNDE